MVSLFHSLPHSRLRAHPSPELSPSFSCWTIASPSGVCFGGSASGLILCVSATLVLCPTWGHSAPAHLYRMAPHCPLLDSHCRHSARPAGVSCIPPRGALGLSSEPGAPLLEAGSRAQMPPAAQKGPTAPQDLGSLLSVGPDPHLLMPVLHPSLALTPHPLPAPLTQRPSGSPEIAGGFRLLGSSSPGHSGATPLLGDT